MRDLTRVLTWRRMNERINAFGQPSESKFAEIRSVVATNIIKPGSHHNKGALATKPGPVAGLDVEVASGKNTSCEQNEIKPDSQLSGLTCHCLLAAAERRP
ncbi:MAG: hypothetical protein RDA78_03465 [Roseibium sp.]|uniref:hypothetical protein n=1 Tax=Roseibium sp. TaxID=1936156 RepID=UPI003D9C2868